MASVQASRSRGALASVREGGPDEQTDSGGRVDGRSKKSHAAGAKPSAPDPLVEPGRNEVHLVGRLGVGQRELTLPSGDTVVSFHLVVSRPPRSAREQERRPREPTVDTLACAAWSSRCRRSVSAAQAGDLLEVEGSLRRRFRRGAGGPVSFYEVEVTSVRRLRSTQR